MAAAPGSRASSTRPRISCYAAVVPAEPETSGPVARSAPASQKEPRTPGALCCRAEGTDDQGTQGSVSCGGSGDADAAGDEGSAQGDAAGGGSADHPVRAGGGGGGRDRAVHLRLRPRQDDHGGSFRPRAGAV